MVDQNVVVVAAVFFWWPWVPIESQGKTQNPIISQKFWDLLLRGKPTKSNQKIDIFVSAYLTNPCSFHHFTQPLPIETFFSWTSRSFSSSGPYTEDLGEFEKGLVLWNVTRAYTRGGNNKTLSIWRCNYVTYVVLFKCFYSKLSLDDWMINFWEPIPFIEPSTIPSHKIFMADMSKHLIPFYLITFITKSFQMNEIITKAKG